MPIALHVWLSVLDKAEGLWEEKVHTSLNQVDGIIYIKAIIHSIIVLGKPRLQTSANLILPKPQDWKTEVSGFKTLGFWIQSLCTFKYSKLPSRKQNCFHLWSHSYSFYWIFFFFHSVNSLKYILYASFGLCSQNTMGNNSGSRTYFQGVYISSKGEWCR